MSYTVTGIHYLLQIIRVCHYQLHVYKCTQYYILALQIQQNKTTYLLVSSFMRPSCMLIDRWALWDSWETVELSVLTPDVTTVSSWWAIGGAISLMAAFPWGTVSSSMSSCSAGSLSDASVKCGRNSESEQTHQINWSWSSSQENGSF